MLQMPTIAAVQDRVQSLAGNHLPEASFQWPKVDLGSVDVSRSLADAATAMHLGHRSRRSRRPLAIVAVLGAATAGWLLWSQEAVRSQVQRWVRSASSRLANMRSGQARSTMTEQESPVAFTAADTAPIVADVYLDRALDPSEYPVGLGAHNGAS